MTPEIKLKLMSGGKVILADCLGYESELFVPVIINKRIVLQNAVLSRRCCKHDSFGNQPFEKSNNASIPCPVPLANSTPTQIIKLPCKENISSSMESYSYPIRPRTLLHDSSEMNLPPEVMIKPLCRNEKTKTPNKVARIVPTTSTNVSQCVRDTSNPSTNRLPTPDIVRRAVVQNANETISLPQYPQLTGLKIVRLHRTNTPNTLKNLAKVLRSKTPLRNTSSPRVLRDLSNLSSFGSPPNLQRTKETNSFECGTPNQSFLARKIKTPGTVTKWRKCITPQRTYLRRINGQKPLSRTTKLQPLQLAKNGKFVENYRLPTNIKSEIFIRRRKLIVDDNVKITPRKFKKQLTNTADLNRNKRHELPKSRKHFNFSHMTAFDLLTNSSFYPKIGKKLNAVFRQGCVNKHAATILKYKQLIKDIPLAEV